METPPHHYQDESMVYYLLVSHSCLGVSPRIVVGEVKLTFMLFCSCDQASLSLINIRGTFSGVELIVELRPSPPISHLVCIIVL